jgi:light-regulated signal transduction histidine kinase (bacteriophytochrome)
MRRSADVKQEIARLLAGGGAGELRGGGWAVLSLALGAGLALCLVARRRASQLAAVRERALAARSRELLAVNRELEAFSYSVSHDLRAPLRAIDGFGRTLADEHGSTLDAEGRELLDRIRAAGRRMSLLVEDVIQLSRVTRAGLLREDVDLSALVRAIAAELADREPSRAVAVVVQDGVRASGDPRLLRIGLANLLENAFKFTRDAPTPRVEFGAREAPEGRVYHVRDNGAGFDMAYASRLFTPFQRLHAASEFEGTGIGLATLQRIVHRHGGEVWAEGAPRQGAAFHFTLDASRANGKR